MALRWVVYVHSAYMLHFGVCDQYSLGLKKMLRRCRVRTDYKVLDRDYLEWIHTFETTFVAALSSWGHRNLWLFFAAAAMFSGVSIFKRVSRRFRFADLLTSVCCATAASSSPLRLILMLHLHAAIVPSRMIFKLSLPSAFLLSLHLLAFAVAFFSSRRSASPVVLPLLAGLLVFLGRDLALALEARTQRENERRLDGEKKSDNDLPLPSPWVFQDAVLFFFDLEEESDDDRFDRRLAMRNNDGIELRNLLSRELQLQRQTLTTIPD